jgi:hypothetical protein
MKVYSGASEVGRGDLSKLLHVKYVLNRKGDLKARAGLARAFRFVLCINEYVAI